jgi:hypothetical protein
MGFKTFHVNSEQVAAERKEPFKTNMQNHLAQEKLRMTKSEYARWYLAEWQNQFKQVFSDELIADAMKQPKEENFGPGDYWLGVDVAHMGGDLTAFEICRKNKDNSISHIYSETKSETPTTWTTNRILELDGIFHFQKIYIDTEGLGIGVFDNLLEKDQVRRKIVDSKNSRRSVEFRSSGKRKDPRERTTQKEDRYANLLRIMENRQIKILIDDHVRLSLKSVIKEEDPITKKIKIYGRDTHIAEALVRAAWCAKEKNIRIWIDYI